MMSSWKLHNNNARRTQLQCADGMWVRQKGHNLPVRLENKYGGNGQICTKLRGTYGAHVEGKGSSFSNAGYVTKPR